MPTKPGPKYKGKLNKPLALLPVWAHPAIRSKGEIIDGRKREIAERLYLLLRHHDIDPSEPDHWYQLAIRLAAVHVRGFQEEQRGNDPEWDYKRERQLYQNVIEKLQPGRIFAEGACKLLQKSKEYNEFKHTTLLRKFEEVKARFEKIDRHNNRERRLGNRPYPTISVNRSAVRVPSSGRAADTLIRTHAQLDALDKPARARAEKRIRVRAKKP